MGGEEGLGVTTGQPNLYKQDLSKLDISKLTALSREVISRQATINIGTIGHVAHGKSTIVKAISGVQTVRFKNELERNITIKLDAANCSSSGESADIPGRTIDSKTPAVSKKRHLSPAGSTDAPSCAKMPRILDRMDRNNISHRLDRRHTLCSSSSTSSLASLLSSTSSSSLFSTSSSSSSLSISSSLISSSSKRLRARQAIMTQQMLKAFDSSSRTRSRSSSARDPGSDGRQSDYEESSSDGRLSAREGAITPRLNCELKEARVMLHDIMHCEKYRELAVARTMPSNPSPASGKKAKVWEVEKILQKREQNGQPVYLIKWKDWDSTYNTWEPYRNLTNCEDLLHEFEEERQKLIDRFKDQTNFYPDACDVQLFLHQMHKNMPIDDATSTAIAIIGQDRVYTEIRRFLKSSSPNLKIEAKIKRQILRMLLIELRRDQLEALQDWENEMNSITKGKPAIEVENRVDLEGAPHDFYYIDNYLPGAGVIIPDDPPIGCECDGECGTGNKSGCCFAQSCTSLPYTSARRMRMPLGTPIYECNKRCACDPSTCPNRVVQRGTDTQLTIFRTDNGRGWGVRTRRAIKKGTFVIQYVGEVIKNEEAENRGKKYNLTGRTYLFDLDYNETDDQCPYTVDAAMYGNVSHFINHSCDPNLAVYAIWINCLDPNLPSLALFAIKDIKQNEELTFDYMCQTQRDNAKRQQLLDDEPEGESVTSKENRMLCKCGAAKCRRYLF